MHEMFTIIRWIHVLSASVWFGQLLVVNAVLLPILSNFMNDTGKAIIMKLVPRLFKNAMHISLVTVFTGLLMIHHYSAGNVGGLFAGKWGMVILTGSIIAIALTIHNIMMFKKTSKMAASIAENPGIEFPPMNKKGPVIGLILVGLVFILMMYASHGF